MEITSEGGKLIAGFKPGGFPPNRTSAHRFGALLLAGREINRLK
jgi:hypothetical protein